MKTMIKILTITTLVAAFTSSAFAATRYHRDYDRLPQAGSYDASIYPNYSNYISTDRESLVEQTGN